MSFGTNQLPTLVFFPGLGANYRLLNHQASHFANFIIPKWIPHVPEESLESYCQRWAEKLRFPAPFYLGGVSFGGMVALELSKYLNPEGIFLISSCRSKEAIGETFRAQEKLGRSVPDALIKPFLETVGLGILSKKEKLAPPEIDNLKKMVFEIDVPFFKWSSMAAATWTHGAGSVKVNAPVHQIHGKKDWVIKLREGDPDTLIEEGKHLIHITHADIVNSYINHIITRNQRARAG